jgi:hypothetical protein
VLEEGLGRIDMRVRIGLVLNLGDVAFDDVLGFDIELAEREREIGRASCRERVS